MPNSTLYYNNININIKEVNINNPKEIKSTKNNTITSFTTKTQRTKNPSQPKRSNTYRYNYSYNYKYNKNKIENNKAYSAKRLFTYNINTKDIHNLKTNINSINHTRKSSNTNININKLNKINKKKSNTNNNLNNLYTISNNTRHYFMNTMYNNDVNYNYNIITSRKTPKFNPINTISPLLFSFTIIF